MKHIPSTQALGSVILVQIVNQSGFTYQFLTGYINDTLNKVIFPDSLKRNLEFLS